MYTRRTSKKSPLSGAFILKLDIPLYVWSYNSILELYQVISASLGWCHKCENTRAHRSVSVCNQSGEGAGIRLLT
jgi:hypothetical protein